jgi:hypothetical protein
MRRNADLPSDTVHGTFLILGLSTHAIFSDFSPVWSAFCRAIAAGGRRRANNFERSHTTAIGHDFTEIGGAQL